MKKSNRRAAESKLRRKSRTADRRRKLQFGFETLEDRQLMAFSAGDIAVLQLAATANNTTGTVLDLSPSTSNQTPVQTISIGATGTNALRFSDSGTSSFLSTSNDGTQLVMAAYNTTDSTTTDLATTGTSLTGGTDPDDRAVATLDTNANLTIQTHYVEATSGDQTRSATTLDDSNYFITDKGGLYTNGATAASLTTNILDTRSFGGVAYVSSTKGASGVSTLSSPTATSLTALPGLPADSSIQDFYLVQSGQNGSTYDTLYTLDQGGSTATINKYYLSGGTWHSAGNYAVKNASGTAINATGMIAEENGNGGVNLYVVTTAQAADNSVVQYTDTAAYNATISVNGANSVTLYTATGTNTLKGIAFAPAPSTAPTVSNLTSTPASTTATLGGTVTSTGSYVSGTTSSAQVNETVTAYGIVYSPTSVNANPTIGGTGVTQVAGSGTAVYNPFTVNATGLQPGVQYSYAAYATNGAGTSYTAVGTFTTTQASPTISGGGNVTLGENHAPYTANLSNISDGENDGNANVTSVSASVTATSNASLFAAGGAPAVNYVNGASTGTLGFTLAPNQTGTATIVVTVTNNLGYTASVTYNLTVNAITTTTAAQGLFTGSSATITSANLNTTETGVTAANIQYTLTGNPPAADGTLYRSGVALAQGSTFTQADVNSGLITYVSTGTGSATDSIPFTVTDLTDGGSLTGQSLSISVVAPPTSLGNLAVMQLGVAGSDNTTGTVLYLNPAATQTTPVQSIPITQMSFSDSGTSSFLSDSNDGSLLAFAAYNTPPGTYTATSDLGEDTATGARGVGTLNASGTFNLAATYTNTVANGSTTEQTRSATTLDDSNWYITDKSGLYTNNDNNPGGPTGPSLSTNILITRAFGGTVYVASTKAAAGVSTLSSPAATTLNALPGIPTDGDIQDFYMIESGTNGNTYDVLYTLDQNATNATINKFSLVSGSWVANGTAYTLPENATAMTAANNGSGGASLYVVTTSQAADNSVVLLTDTAGWNSPLSVAAAPVTVYTATGGASLKGVAFAPTDLPNFSVTAAAPATAALASQFNYTLTASNAGPADADGDVEVQFTLPAGVSYISAADNGNDGFTASYDSATNVVTFTGGTLTAGASDNLTVTVSAASPATYTVPVGGVVIDPNHLVPEGTEFVDNYNTSAVSTLVTNEADLTVNVSGPSSAYANQPFSYTLSAANLGTVDADGDVVVQFTLPTSDPNLQFVSASAAGFTASEANGVVTFSGGTITAGNSATLTVTVEDTSAQLVANGVITPDSVTVPVGAAVISTSDNIPESSDNQTSTSTVTTAVSSPFQITGIDVSPVVNQSFTGVVATFTDATDSNIGDLTATITWANGATTSGTIGVAPNQTVTDASGNIVNIENLYTVTGTYTYTSVGNYPVSVSVSDVNNNTASVALNATVGYAPLVVTAGPAVNANSNVPVSNATVATFTDPGLVANMAALGISDPTTQFSASINWGDGSSADSGTISYNATTQVFSVVGSHTYAQTGSYSVSVAVTPLTVSVERIDSSDPTNLNAADDQSAQENYVNGNLADANTAFGLTDAPSADFIDQYAVGAGGQAGPLYTFSLPTVATTSGSYAVTDNSSSRSEGELTLSANGQYLIMGGYNSTVDLWAPEPGLSTASQVNRVAATVSGTGVINTTTAIDNAYSGGNFRGVVSNDGQEFWTAGSSSGATDEYTRYAQLGASVSTQITGPSNPANTTAVEIFNGQLYESTRSTPGSTLAGIYQVGNGLPTTAGQTQTLFIAVPQSNPLNVTDSEGTTAGFGFYMADLPSNPNSINGVNVAYVADEQMGISRYDYGIVGNETTPQWNFSYYINSTGSFLNSAYTVDGNGDVTPTSSAVTNNPAAYADPSKAGGARELTGRVVDGQVQLFFLTGFGTGSRPITDDSLMELTDTGANSSYTVLATDTGTSQLTGVAFTPTQTVSSTANVAQQVPTVTVADNGGTYNGSAFTATDTVNGGASLEGVTPTLSYYSGTVATGAASNVAPSTAGTYTVVASFSGSTDYTRAAASTTFTIGQATSTVTVTDNGGTYNGSAFAATETVNGGASLEGVTPTATYYSGTAATGPASSVAPSTAGTYTVVASFSGSTDYASGAASATFTIGQATPTVTVADNGGTYNGSAYAATDSVNGGASLESVAPTLTYYAGTAASGTASSVAPSTAGTYTVVASFAGSTDYTTAAASTTFSITGTTPTVSVSDAGGTYNGSAYAATATVNGGASLEGVTPTVTYYSGTAASGTALSGAPSNAGTYTVVASFAGSTDYAAAQSSPATFVISPKAVSYTIGNAVEIEGTTLNLASVLPATFSTGIGSQTLALSYSSSGDSASAALGVYPINATAGNTSSGLASNYSVSFTLGTLSVIPNPSLGILLLDGSADNSLNVSGSGKVSVTGGGNLVLDSTDTHGAVTVSGAAVVSASTVDAASTAISGSGEVEGTLNTTAGQTADPLASLPVPAVPTTVQSSHQLVIGGVSVVTLQPGLYVGGIEVTASAKVTLAPGLYYLQGGGFTVSGAASVNGTGVLLYNAPPAGGGSAGSINVSGSGIVNLTGMESGIYQGLAIFQASTATAAIQVSGAAGLNVTGSIYAAAATVQVSGSGDLNLNGTTVSEAGSELVLADHLIVADMQVSGAADVTVNTSVNSLALSPSVVDYYFGS